MYRKNKPHTQKTTKKKNNHQSETKYCMTAVYEQKYQIT